MMTREKGEELAKPLVDKLAELSIPVLFKNVSQDRSYIVEWYRGKTYYLVEYWAPTDVVVLQKTSSLTEAWDCTLDNYLNFVVNLLNP